MKGLGGDHVDLQVIQKAMSVGQSQDWEPNADRYQFKDLRSDVETTWAITDGDISVGFECRAEAHTPVAPENSSEPFSGCLQPGY